MIRAYVDFSKVIREWDGFGVCFSNRNCMKSDIDPYLFKLDFQYLSKSNQNKIADLIFGSEGLRVGLIKTYINSYQLKKTNVKYNDGTTLNLSDFSFNPFDKSTQLFCDSAIDVSAKWGGTIRLLCTFTNPPEWMTKQNITGARDLDPTHRIDYACAMVAGIKILTNNSYPVHYLSMHYHGEEWGKWNNCGDSTNNKMYSLFWPPEQVADFLKLLRRILDKNGLLNIKLTPGETSNWLRFCDWGYSNAIIDDPLVLNSLGLLTSSDSAIFFNQNNIFAINSSGIDEIREKRPDLHAWFTSFHHIQDNPLSLLQIRQYIYNSKINSVFIGDVLNSESDDSSQSLFRTVNDTLFIPDSYYYLKLICRAGQPGMAVCQVACNILDIYIIGFSSNNTRNHNSFIILNTSMSEYELPIEIRGCSDSAFSIYRTSSFEKCLYLGIAHVKEGKIHFKIAPFSATAFYSSI